MKPARRFIENQLRPQQERLLRAINKLPYEGDILPLSGRKNEYRLRVGDYRVIYSLYDDVVTVVVMTVGNRGDIYK
ncbi:MAG: type II toxin-antitoxin system RelE/ParE family toxin [Oscillospiraceae bacterium]|jgi:mRNA interferase RelE/StbE|nr:type II toxin-antitoxin system RelE/ParE family toxin [Oscillospiraceae bacterium]